jgi:hypothetical protein
LKEYIGSAGDNIYRGTDLATLQLYPAANWIDSWAVGNGMWTLQNNDPQFAYSTGYLYAAG